MWNSLKKLLDTSFAREVGYHTEENKLLAYDLAIQLHECCSRDSL